MQTYWNFYVTLALAYIAFFGATKATRNTKLLAGILSVAFLAFAYVNLDALIAVTEQRLALRDLLIASPTTLQDVPSTSNLINQTLHAPTMAGLISLHVAGDILVLGAVWFLALRGISGAERS